MIFENETVKYWAAKSVDGNYYVYSSCTGEWSRSLPFASMEKAEKWANYKNEQQKELSCAAAKQ